MGMETQLLLLASPFVVAGITWLVKQHALFDNLLAEPYRTYGLRLVVALCSFGSVVGSAALSGQPIDPASIQTLATAILTFLGATGTYFFFKKA